MLGGPWLGVKTATREQVTVAVGGEVMFTDDANTKVNIAWTGTPPACCPACR